MENAEAQGSVKRIDFKKNHILCEKEFEGNNKPRKYYFTDTLSIERYEIFEDLEMLVAKGRSYADIYKSEMKIHEYLNAGKMADAAIENHNSMILVREKLEKRHHSVMRMVALFANIEGEDTKKYDELVIEKKILDWKNEGFAMNDFFSLAFNLVEDYLESYKQVSQGLLSKPEKSTLSTETGKSGKSGGQKSSQESVNIPDGDMQS